jgi:hypothetical protein
MHKHLTIEMKTDFFHFRHRKVQVLGIPNHSKCRHNKLRVHFERKTERQKERKKERKKERFKKDIRIQ